MSESAALCCAALCCAVLCCAVLCCAVLSCIVLLFEPRQHAGTCLVIREARAGQAIKLSAVKVHDMTFSIAPLKTSLFSSLMPSCWQTAVGRSVIIGPVPRRQPMYCQSTCCSSKFEPQPIFDLVMCLMPVDVLSFQSHTGHCGRPGCHGCCSTWWCTRSCSLFAAPAPTS